MATKLDGETLALLSDSVAKTSMAGANEVDAIGRMVAAHATDVVRADYVTAMTGRNLTDGNGTSATPSGSSFLNPGYEIRADDAEARAVGTVLGSIESPAAAERALSALAADPAKLDAVTASAIGRSQVGYANGNLDTLTHDPTIASRVATTAASVSDPALKAQVFGSIARSSREMGEGAPLTVESGPDRAAANATLARSLTTLVRSDTNGIVDELQANRSAFDGAEMASYAELALAAGQGGSLGQVLSDLQLGNDGTGDPARRFYGDQLDGNPVTNGSPEAANLGYFVGSVYSGAAALKADSEAAVQGVETMLDVAATLAGAAPHPAVGTSAGLAKTLIGEAMSSGADDVAAANRVEAETLDRAAVPHGPDGRVPVQGSAGESAYNAQVERVTRLVETSR